jgi:hypothetical protein
MQTQLLVVDLGAEVAVGYNDAWNTLCRANVSATSMRAPCGSAHRSPPLIFLWYQYKHFGGKSMTGKEERIKTDDSYRSDEHKN